MGRGRRGANYWAAWLVLLGAALLLVGCGTAVPEEKMPVAEQSDRLQIGMSFDSFVIERWLRDRDQFELTAKELGADVNVQVANGSAQEQISQIQYFIKKKVDVIVVIAVDGEALAEVVEEAKDEGIRVISYDRLLVNADSDLYISFDNEKVGTLMGEAIASALPDGGNIFAIYGSPTDNNVAMVQKGFLDAIKGKGLEIVYSNYCGNWLAELAFDAVEEGLSTTPRNLAGVMCGNDDLASQAFRALAENRLAGRVVLVGQDAELSACQRIVEGTQTMTVYKPVEQLAMRAAEFAAALGYEKMLAERRIQEREIPDLALQRAAELKELATINDAGTPAQYLAEVEGVGQQDVQVSMDEERITVDIGAGHQIPYYAIDPIAVTRENIDEVIIGSDFHTHEDVYRNVE